MQIHLLCLQSPFRSIAHSPETPEKQNKKVNHGDAAQRDQSFFAEGFFEVTEAGRRDVDHFAAATPKEQSGNQHGYARNAKGPARSPIRLLQEPRTQERRDKRAGINREIKPAEHF